MQEPCMSVLLLFSRKNPNCAAESPTGHIVVACAGVD